MSNLRLRLKNCLQTILELEPSMRESGEDSFDAEFSSIKSFLSHIDQMDLAEEEVQWMENVTVIVLSELAQLNPSRQRSWSRLNRGPLQ